jgi:pyruvate formate lyase activating enzyme
VMESVLPYVDLVMFDVKHVDSDLHRQGTGVGNELILENLRRIAGKGRTRLWLRMPVIPGFNDSTEYFTMLAETIRGLPAEKVSLLTYHEWGKPKYEALGREFKSGVSKAPSPEKMEALADIIRSAGFEATVDY